MAQGQPDEDRKGLVGAFPARVLTLGPGDVDRLTALVRDRHAFDPTILDERSPFFWPAEISSNRLDAYYTRMAPSSLRNYAADAADGVSFQNSHRHDELGFGRSLTGKYEETTELARVLSEFYTVPGLRLNGVSTDDFILGVRSGLLKDVSIGFYDAFFRCSICAQSIWSWDCPHIPGVKYPQVNKQGDVVGDELAFVWVENARLSEVSAVYDGATPGAAILKAEQEAEGGRLRPEVAGLLEARYRIKLPGAGRHWSGATTSGATRREGEMPEQEVVVTPPAGEQAADYETRMRAAQDFEDRVRAALGITAAVSEIETIQALRADAEAAGGLRSEVARLAPFEPRALDAERQLDALRPLADDGRQYRADVIAEALGEGVRAYGQGFASDTYRAVLEAAPLATVKRMRDDWRTMGDKLFAGGRQTQDHAEPEEKPGKKNGTPDAAFRG